MAHIFTTAVVGLVIYMNVHVLIPHTSARPLQRHERQTQPFSVDDILHFGLEALDKTAVSLLAQASGFVITTTMQNDLIIMHMPQGLGYNHTTLHLYSVLEFMAVIGLKWKRYVRYFSRCTNSKIA